MASILDKQYLGGTKGSSAGIPNPTQTAPGSMWDQFDALRAAQTAPPPGYSAGSNPGYHGPGIGVMGGAPTGPWATPQQGYQGYPPTGLMGSEQALMGGLQGGLGGLLGGIQQGRGDVLSQLRGGLQSYQNALGAGNRAFGQGAAALRDAQGGIDGYFDRGIGQGNQFFNQGADALNPFIAPGYSAQQRQAALSGAMGPEAQKQAMQSFMDSPGQQWLREQGERSVTRNAAALGGLGGGNVMKELTRFGTGLAAQDFDNQFNRLGQVTNQGLQAAGQYGSLRGQQGAMNASLRGQQAGLQGNLANSLANLYSNKAKFGGNMAQGMAGLRAGAGSLLGNMGLQGGLAAGNMAYGTGQNLAAGRTRAGEMIAGNIAGNSSALSNLINQQGAGIADLIGQGGGNLANLLAGAGMGQGMSQQQLQTILANIATGQGSQAAGLPGIGGIQQTSGNAGDWANLINAAATAYQAWGG